MKNCILYNPNANNGKCKEVAEQFAANLKGGENKLCDITKIGTYKDFFAGLDAETAVIICGGDGTLNRFVNETAGLDYANKIYYYPMGSGNDFWRDVEHTDDEPLEMAKYLTDLPEVIVKGKTYKFLNNVGFGIDGYCCEVGDKLKETSDKPINYTGIAIKGLLFHYKKTNATVIVDGVKHEYKNVWLAPTMNGRYYGGGMMPTPDQNRLGDGTLSVMVYHCWGKLKALMAFPSIFKGEHVKKTGMVEVLTGREITVKFDGPRAVQIDGETILGVTEYSAKAVKNAAMDLAAATEA